MEDFLDGNEFDPSSDFLNSFDDFDPKGGLVDQYRNPAQRGKFDATKGLEGIITIRMQNKKNQQLRIELWNTLKHITKIPNPAQYSGISAGSNFVPVSGGYSIAALGILMNQSITAYGTVYNVPPFAVFNDFDGSLCYVAGTVFTNPVSFALIQTELQNGNEIDWRTYASAIVSCSQLPYRQLVDAFIAMVWRINQTKVQTSSDNQIKQAMAFVYYSPLGGIENNSLEPSEFFQPENQQTKLVNINKKYEIDANTAIYITLEPLEDMQHTLRVEAFRNNAVLWGGRQASAKPIQFKVK